MIDIKNIDRVLEKYPQSSVLTDDFESRVYAKIKTKKRQRTITYSFSIVILLMVSFFIAQVFIGSSSAPVDNYASRMNNSNTKEEIPLVEDVYFSLTDSNTNYVIEQVNYSADDGSI